MGDEENDKFEKELEEVKQSFSKSLPIERPKVRVQETKRSLSARRHLAEKSSDIPIDDADGNIARRRLSKVLNKNAAEQPEVKVTIPEVKVPEVKVTIPEVKVTK